MTIRFMSAQQILEEFFAGTDVTRDWIVRNLRAGRTKLGRGTVVWNREQVEAWLAAWMEH